MTTRPDDANSPNFEAISRREAARRKGVSVNRAIRFFKRAGSEAVLPTGEIDASHPVYLAWLNEDPEADIPAALDAPATPDRDAFLRLEFKKKSAELRKLDLGNAERDGSLIPKEFVKQHILALIDGSWRALLIDAPKTIARRVYAAAKAGEPIEEGEKIVKSIISDTLGHVKDRARALLKAPQAPTEDEDRAA